MKLTTNEIADLCWSQCWQLTALIVLVALLGATACQQSKSLPLSDLPFTRTSLGEWEQRHPSTRIYVGETDSSPTDET